MLIPIPDRFIPVFNWMERARIEEPTYPLVRTKPHNLARLELKCLNDGVVVSLNGNVKRVLPRNDGFRNLQHLGVALRMP